MVRVVCVDSVIRKEGIYQEYGGLVRATSLPRVVNKQYVLLVFTCVSDDTADTIPYVLPVLCCAKQFPARRLGIYCPFISFLGSHVFLDHIMASARGCISDAPFFGIHISSFFSPSSSGLHQGSFGLPTERFCGIAVSHVCWTHLVYRSTTSSSRSHEFSLHYLDRQNPVLLCAIKRSEELRPPSLCRVVDSCTTEGPRSGPPSGAYIKCDGVMVRGCYSPNHLPFLRSIQ
ncbi:hypothetical protein EVAR_48919_1 [Eumeta japonica]|uniref:Uncharacterized protein n=1 Tax=Eumeta variegata TaxID=151549 RepID=A0A4C1YT44_EUMVA|nr:hypothetical protein EVAR_48919_1 [Eumeta japonica]